MTAYYTETKSGVYGSSLESTFEPQTCITGKCPPVSHFCYLLIQLFAELVFVSELISC